MSPYAGARLVDIDPGVLIGHLYHIQTVYVQFIANLSQFVRQSDVHITEGVFHAFGEFSSLSLRLNNLAFYECGVDVRGMLCTGRSYPTNDAVIVFQFIQNLAGQQIGRAHV